MVRKIYAQHVGANAFQERIPLSKSSNQLIVCTGYLIYSEYTFDSCPHKSLSLLWLYLSLVQCKWKCVNHRFHSWYCFWILRLVMRYIEKTQICRGVFCMYLLVRTHRYIQLSRIPFHPVIKVNGYLLRVGKKFMESSKTVSRPLWTISSKMITSGSLQRVLKLCTVPFLITRSTSSMTSSSSSEIEEEKDRLAKQIFVRVIV